MDLSFPTPNDPLKEIIQAGIYDTKRNQLKNTSVKNLSGRNLYHGKENDDAKLTPQDTDPDPEATGPVYRPSVLGVAEVHEGDESLNVASTERPEFDGNSNERKKESEPEDASVNSEHLETAVTESNPLYWNQRGIYFYDLGALNAAMECYERAISIDENFKESWCNLGNVFSSLGENEKAIGYYDRAIAIDINFSKAWFFKGDALYEMKRYEEAIECHFQAYKLDGDIKKAWMIKGIDLCDMDEWEKALECFDEVIQMDNDCHLAWFLKGDILEKNFQTVDAIECYFQGDLIQNGPKEAWFIKGVKLGFIGQKEESIECYNKAIEMDEKFKTAIDFKRRALSRLGRHEEAVACCDQMIRIDENDVEAWCDKGVALSSLGHREKAIRCFEKAIEINKSFSIAWGNMGITLNDLGRKKEAMECYDRAIEINADDKVSWNNKGDILFSLGQFEDAIECFNRTIEIDEDDLFPLCNKGEVLLELYRDSEAKESLEKCVGSGCVSGESDKTPESLTIKGRAFFLLGRYTDAAPYFDKAIGIDPFFPQAWLCKGDNLRNMGRFEEALKCYDVVIQINPNSDPAWDGKATTLFHLSRYEEALVCIQNTLEINPHRGLYWVHKASVVHALGQMVEALECLTHAICINSRNVNAWKMKLSILEELQREEERNECFGQAQDVFKEEFNSLFAEPFPWFRTDISTIPSILPDVTSSSMGDTRVALGSFPESFNLNRVCVPEATSSLGEDSAHPHVGRVLFSFDGYEHHSNQDVRVLCGHRLRQRSYDSDTRAWNSLLRINENTFVFSSSFLSLSVNDKTWREWVFRFFRPFTEFVADTYPCCYSISVDMSERRIFLGTGWDRGSFFQYPLRRRTIEAPQVDSSKNDSYPGLIHVRNVVLRPCFRTIEETWSAFVKENPESGTIHPEFDHVYIGPRTPGKRIETKIGGIVFEQEEIINWLKAGGLRDLFDALHDRWENIHGVFFDTSCTAIRLLVSAFEFSKQDGCSIEQEYTRICTQKLGIVPHLFITDSLPPRFLGSSCSRTYDVVGSESDDVFCPGSGVTLERGDAEMTVTVGCFFDKNGDLVVESKQQPRFALTCCHNIDRLVGKPVSWIAHSSDGKKARKRIGYVFATTTLGEEENWVNYGIDACLIYLNDSAHPYCEWDHGVGGDVSVHSCTRGASFREMLDIIVPEDESRERKSVFLRGWRSGPVRGEIKSVGVLRAIDYDAVLKTYDGSRIVSPNQVFNVFEVYTEPPRDLRGDSGSSVVTTSGLLGGFVVAGHSRYVDGSLDQEDFSSDDMYYVAISEDTLQWVKETVSLGFSNIETVS